MILMQQKKIAALDEANARLVKELSRLGDKLERTTKLAAVARQGRINRVGLMRSLYFYLWQSIIQGDTSCSSRPAVDLKTKVAL